jgi:HEAT repeat protein
MVRARIVRLASVASIILALAPVSASAQDGWVETTFHRVFLKNGNFIDGHIVKQSPLSVTLQLMKAGEMSIKVDMIDRIEFVKMRSVQEAPKRESLRPPGVDPQRPLIAPPVNPRTDAPPTPPVSSDRSTKLRLPEELYRPRDDTRIKADVILHAVEAADIESRDQIALKLKDVGGDVAPYLASLLEQSSRDLGLQILQVLFRMKDPQAVPVILELLRSPNSVLRGQSAALLAETQGTESLKSLGGLLKDEDPAVRQTLVTLIQRHGTGEAVDTIAPLLVDPDRDVRTRAQGVILDLAQKFNRLDRLAALLGGAIDFASPRLRPELLAMLGKSHLPDTWRIAQAHLSDDDPEARRAAAGALGALGEADSGNAVLSQIARERDDFVRPALADAAQRLKIMSAIPYLIDWLDGTPDVKTSALRALQVLSGTSLGADRQVWDEWWKRNSQK